MNIHVCGINYKAAPVDVREKLSFTESEQVPALEAVNQIKDVNECILVSTCNRTELYVYSESESFNSSVLENKICQIKGLDAYDFKKYFYFYSGLNAVRHLFKVASGLDSMVLGEDQILGQVKHAHDIAREAGTSHVILNTLFRDAVTAAKKVKTLTGISKKSVSVSTLGVKLVQDVFGSRLEDKNALIIGTGKIGTITLKNLISAGIGQIVVTNRSHGRAAGLLKDYPELDFVDYQERYSIMDKADIVVSSTSSPHYTVTRDILEKVIIQDKKRIFIDLAVPRDIDEDIQSINGVMYYNIDNLRETARENADEKLLEAIKAGQIIDEYIIDFEKWYGFRNVLPLVKEIQRHTGDFAHEKIMNTISRLKTVSDEEKELIKNSMNSIVKTLLNKFVYDVRENGSKEDIEVYFRCLGKLVDCEHQTVNN
jgi:glutamyl-tRNA reductase